MILKIAKKEFVETWRDGLGLTIIVPAFLTFFVAKIHPVASRFEFIAAMREARRGTATRANEILENFYRKNPEMRPAEPDKGDFMPGFYAAQIERDGKFLPMLRGYEDQLSRQNGLAEDLRTISPPIAAQSALNDLAATSFDRYQSFLNQVHEFHREWQGFFLLRLFRGERLKADDYERFPKFEFAEEPLGPVLRRVLFGLLSILLPTFLLGV